MIYLQMSDFVASTHLASRMAVVGLGVDHDGLVSYTKSLGVGSGDGVPAVGSYGSGNLRQENGAAVTCVAVAGAGARYEEERDCCSCNVSCA